VNGDHEAVRRYGDASLPVLRRLPEDVGRLAGVLGLMAQSALALATSTGRARSPRRRSRSGGARATRSPSHTRVTLPV
jgi:hypothetical protein